MSAKKERLVCNVTKETLFVGVGGIGSDIVVRVAERCRGTEADNIKFVAMDTNANDLKCVKNSKANIVPIQTSSTQSVLDYLKKDDDARNNWFPNNTTLYSKTVSEGAGQVRAISRLALNATIKTGEIQKLYKAIDELFLKDGGDLKQALRVVVVSSACGGTGSGIAMTVGMLIREYLHKNYREKAAIIRGYLLLPGVMDTVIRTETEKESLRRNGYATIKEINSFMIKASGFCGVRKELERYKDLYIDGPTTTGGVDKLEGLPFDFCFLLDRVDQSQESMQTLEQYKDFAARSLYEQNIGPMEKDAFGIEDNIIKEFANGNNLGRNRFGGIGASTLRYPYEDIVDYVAYSRAISCIGDGETVGEWLKYDKAFENEKAEFKKRRAYTMAAPPERGAVYVDQVNQGHKRFDIDIKGNLAQNVDKTSAEVMSRVNTFVSAFSTQITQRFEATPAVKKILPLVKEIGREKDYEKDESLRGHATENLEVMREYEQEVKRNASSTARSTARSILFDAPAITGELMPYNLEKMLVTNEGAMHPNAMRYMLYVLRQKFDELYREQNGKIDSLYNKLDKYSQSADDPDFYDVKGGFTSKSEENNFDAVCNLENAEPSFFEKSGYKPLWNKLNELFVAYKNDLDKYCKAALLEAAYEAASKYIKQLCEEFEAFYGSFETKVYSLSKAQDELVDSLKFKEGNSIAYVCATRRHLDRIAQICPTGGDDLMLPPELSGKIFEGIKKNAESARVAEYDPMLAKPKTDIFDAIMIDYFKDSVRNDCDETLNINIVKAIQQEQAFNAYFKALEQADEDEVVFTPEISDSAMMEYLREKIKFGNRLASPGIGYANFNEPRNVLLCAYNEKLKELRDVSINAIVQPFNINATATNTVSRYDLHFFNALYNITPDVLARFKSPEKCTEDGQYNEDAGIYFKAYHEYIKKLGPDSTKSGAISLHIDKRWDSLTEMPELSMDAHYDEMVKIHSALIYGIAYGMIKKYQSSRYDVRKRVYALEDTQGELNALVVSNNTECDEFYEVLDALYRDRASVAKIYEMEEERCIYDVNSNHRYTESGFFKEANLFKIGDGHKAPTSLFEIPLMYFNSLPRAKMDDNELSIMIDSVINVLESEINKYEQEADRAPFLSNRLEEQFKLLVANFQNDEYNEDEAMRKNTVIHENKVVNMVFKKVSNKIKALNTFGFAAKIDALRDLIKE